MPWTPAAGLVKNSCTPERLTEQRWLRIIPVALIMYTISYVDRTNISLALEPRISTMMKDLMMDDKMKGIAAGIFFYGYILLQIPGGHWAARWSARKVISIFLMSWGVCAIGCGLAHTYAQFNVTRFLLGMAESGVFPATTVLLASWFPRAERARANAYWNLCQPFAVMTTAPINGWLLQDYGWRKMMIFEGMLPFVWLPIWWFCIRDHPGEAKWLSAEERAFLETKLRQEAADLQPSPAASSWKRLLEPTVLVMVAIYFLHNCQAYGCMTFFTSGLKGRGFSDLQYGFLFAVPYAVTAIIMVINSWHSDKTNERRGHVAAVYALSGVSLILSVSLKNHFWISYALMCLAIPGPFAAMAPFWSIPTETLPRNVMALVVGIVNAFGNVGGAVGPTLVGWLKQTSGSVAIPFGALGVGMLLAAGLAFLLPKAPRVPSPAAAGPAPASEPEFSS
jgi:MFS family permease